MRKYMGNIRMGMIIFLILTAFGSMVVKSQLCTTLEVGLYIGVILGSLLLSTVMVLLKPIRNKYFKIEQMFEKGAKNLWKNKTKVLVVFVLIIALYEVAFLAEKARVYLVDGAAYSRERMGLLYVGMLILASIILLWKRTKENPEILFAIAAFLLGSFFIMTVPKSLGISWDDQIHYKATAELSFGLDDQISKADFLTIMSGLPQDKESQKVWNKTINDIARNENGIIDIGEGETSFPCYVAYIPGAVGLMAGRAMNLDFTHMFVLGKWMNLLVYVFVFVIAIRIIKRGKILLCAIGLIPMNLFLTADYSYDWWVTCFVMLGYAMFIAELQKEHREISLKKWIGILCVLVIGILPKAVYFPLIFPILFIGRKRFSKNTGLQWYWISNFLAMLFLMATFILPMLLQGPGSDVRGGSDVDAAKQIVFILCNPLQYSKILLKFLKDYIAFDTSRGYLTDFAYLGMGRYFVLTLVTVVVSAFLEGSRKEPGAGRLFKAVFGFTAFATMCLVATALYISFTAVGYETIMGCQPRYLLPLLFPVLYFLAECNIGVSRLNKSAAASLVIMILSFVFMSNVFELCIAA